MANELGLLKGPPREKLYLLFIYFLNPARVESRSFILFIESPSLSWIYQPDLFSFLFSFLT